MQVWMHSLPVASTNTVNAKILHEMDDGKSVATLIFTAMCDQ